MNDVTAVVAHLCFLVAAGLFLVGFYARKSATGEAAVDVRGQVRVWAYVPGDLLGAMAIWGIFYAFSMMSIMAAAGAGEGAELGVSLESLVFSIGFQVFMAAGATAIMTSRLSPVDWLGLNGRSGHWYF